MDEAIFVDIDGLRNHIDIIREKQRNARRLFEQLSQVASRISPELYNECETLRHFAEDLYRYYMEQETLLSEMSARYAATNEIIDDEFETATQMAQYLF